MVNASITAERQRSLIPAYDPIDEIEDELQSAFGGVGVALPEPGIEDVAGLGDAGHQGMIHTLMVVAVPGRTGLMAVDLDRQAVDVDGQISLPVTAAHAPEPPPRQLGDRLTQNVAVRRRAVAGRKLYSAYRSNA